jgi:hypothetical protein
MCMELAKVMVYLQVMVWAFTELLLLKPTTNPYAPKRKLSSCSQWLQSWLKYINDSFDNMATIYLEAPLIHIKGAIARYALAPLGGLSITKQLHVAGLLF